MGTNQFVLSFYWQIEDLGVIESELFSWHLLYLLNKDDKGFGNSTRNAA